MATLSRDEKLALILAACRRANGAGWAIRPSVWMLGVACGPLVAALLCQGGPPPPPERFADLVPLHEDAAKLFGVSRDWSVYFSSGYDGHMVNTANAAFPADAAEGFDLGREVRQYADADAWHVDASWQGRTS